MERLMKIIDVAYQIRALIGLIIFFVVVIIMIVAFITSSKDNSDDENNNARINIEEYVDSSLTSTIYDDIFV